jgi:hypothetical protein
VGLSDGSRGIRASGSRPIHQRRCGVLVPWRCPVLTQPWPLVRFAGRRLIRTAPAVKAAGRASERNDILPRLAIARHPQLMTDKSAVSPLDKIALKSIPGGRAKRMECSVHNVPPTPAAPGKPNLLCCNVCDVRHKNHSSELSRCQAHRGSDQGGSCSARAGRNRSRGSPPHRGQRLFHRAGMAPVRQS